ncbi:lytic transglycosylase domain-containing protein [Arsenophonus nasoniae]|uniref:Lytic transglycosylase domain-containing protein n=1 Tax=Arsenophonus nasoniae TaxID=638 RepID=A0AA95KFB3_9GAMM|nr:lytic transglycosylase domain-containing protein [Arsenophonus nasoniae]WGM03744.1 lytic transglycosylase domain-containing protein [Arsenophonus nasoniae]
MLSTTAFLALAMQCAPSVHPDTVLDIARVESGFNPYAIAEIIPKSERQPDKPNVISYHPKTDADAIRLINQIEQKKRRYSVGLMQITSTNFNHYRVTARDLLEPCTNLAIFEKILTDCYQRGGSLKRALSCYYTGNFSTGQKKEETFNHTSYIERIGYKKTPQYVVPSVKQDITDNRRTLTAVAPSLSKKNITRYPRHLLRGEFVTD